MESWELGSSVKLISCLIAQMARSTVISWHSEHEFLASLCNALVMTGVENDNERSYSSLFVR